MSTASIKKPMIIRSDESAKILADILEAPSKSPSTASTIPVQRGGTGKSILEFLKLAK